MRGTKIFIHTHHNFNFHIINMLPFFFSNYAGHARHFIKVEKNCTQVQKDQEPNTKNTRAPPELPQITQKKQQQKRPTTKGLKHLGPTTNVLLVKCQVPQLYSLNQISS